MNKIILFLYIYFILFCSSCNTNDKPTKVNVSHGDISEWVVPTQNNWKKLKNILNVDNSVAMNFTKHLVFYDLENGFGMAQSAFINNVEGGITYQLFETYNNEILLKQTKVNIIEKYQKDNIYWKLPSNSDTAFWVNHIGEYYDSCISYWGKSKIKGEMKETLVVERRKFWNDSKEIIERNKEIYQKEKGIYEIKQISVETGKLLFDFIVSEVGIDKNLTSDKFPLRN